MESVPSREAGVASEVNNAVSRIAGLLAVAVFGLVLSAGFNRRLSRSLAQMQLSPLCARAPKCNDQNWRALKSASCLKARLRRSFRFRISRRDLDLGRTGPSSECIECSDDPIEETHCERQQLSAQPAEHFTIALQPFHRGWLMRNRRGTQRACIGDGNVGIAPAFPRYIGWVRSFVASGFSRLFFRLALPSVCKRRGARFLQLRVR